VGENQGVIHFESDSRRVDAFTRGGGGEFEALFRVGSPRPGENTLYQFPRVTPQDLSSVAAGHACSDRLWRGQGGQGFGDQALELSS
jgi:hypothetical protein